MKILFFASLREQLGCDSTALQAEEQSQTETLEDLLKVLQKRGEPWASVLDSERVLAAINQDMAALSSPVSADDEIAFFPPVTGG